MFSPEAMHLLKSHNWPGNIRELANVVEHAAILCDALPITVDHLPDRLSTGRPRQPQFNATHALSLREIEMQAIRNSLDRNAGNKPKTAEELGISLKTLYNKLHQEAELERTA